ncbi:replication factor C small subunit [Catovirus CTV1]|uniref:Replication factor C small subunit n=1 Tax=Catovirus CTV1 TaxID=1977631 RepID=A0A1V0SBV5_9VIRU|nr:replication factor C small subunit [Catovirus CTV1]
MNIDKVNKQNNMPWVDKYRPKKLDDIVHQEEVIKVLKTTLETGQLPHLLLYGSSGTGKCLGINTPVIMYDGSIKMVQDVRQNDLLMGDDNTARKVLSLARGKDKMYKIMQDNGDDYIVNSEHIISLKLSGSFLEKWDEKKQEYRLVWFENHEKQQKSFTFNQKNYLKQFKQDLLTKQCVNKKGDICDISIKDYLKKSKEWKSLYKGFKCQQINCWKKKETKFDPYGIGYRLVNEEITDEQFDNYKINDIETRLQFLAGYLDANGHMDKENNFEISVKCKKTFDHIVFIARSLGLKVEKSNTLSNMAKIYGKVPTRIKKQKLDEHNNENLYGIKIKKLKYDNYYGFEIDGNKRFILGDFTVTHNTSTILAVAYQLFGPKIFRERVIELNASDERGINIVRYKINTFARTAIGNVDPNYPCPPFKLVILDEADAMTTEAQSALRKVMEELSSITRFCFICNYKNQIIDPIVSRCMKFRFKPINKISMFNKLKDLSEKEKMTIDDNSLKAISHIVKGDVRKGIMILQNLRYIQNYKSKITVDDVYNMTGYTFPEYIKPIWNLCLNKKTKIETIVSKLDVIRRNATPITSILENLQQIVVDSNLDDDKKSKICLHIASTEKCLTDGADEYIQLLNIFSYIYGLVNGHITYVPDNIC